MRRTLLVPAALVLSLAACAQDDDPGEATPSPTTTPTAAVDETTTAPGTDLSFGEAATLVWQPTSSVTGELELSVVKVAEQDQSVFDGWVRDDVMAASRPYFVTVTATNVGEADLAGTAVPLYLRDDAGKLGAPWTLGGDFTACQSGPLPTPFATGADERLCLVYLVPDGARIQDLVFEPTEGYDPISWTGDVTAPSDKSGKTAMQSGKQSGRGADGKRG